MTTPLLPTTIPFLGREPELSACRKFVLETLGVGDVGSLCISGNSGVGKSHLCRHLLSEIARNDDRTLCLYLDLVADELSATNVIETLVSLAWSSQVCDPAYPLQVPLGADFLGYIRKASIRDSVRESLFSGLSKTVALIPTFGPAIDGLLPDKPSDHHRKDPHPDVAVVFFGYLAQVAETHPVVVALDNFQFLPAPLRMIIQARCRAIGRNLLLVTVNRTENGTSAIANDPRLIDRHLDIALANFDESDTSEYLQAVLGPIEESVKERVLHDALLKTGGNAKELEFYLMSFKRKGAHTDGIAPFLRSMERLPLLERSLLALSALFPAGIRIPYAVRMLSSLFTEQESSERVHSVIEELVAIGYLVINGAVGDTLKPSHEKVIKATQNALDEEEFLELRTSVIEAFEQLLGSASDRQDYAYLLHCLVGVLTFNEVIQRLGAFTALVELQHRQGNHHYLRTLYEHFPGVIQYVPSRVALAFLDAFQKTSEFFTGMAALRELESAGTLPRERLQLFLAKYLVQTYRFEEAISVLDGVPQSMEALMCRLNALQCLGSEDESREGVQAARARRETGEAFFIILRNSAHLYPPRIAYSNLLEALQYFERSGSQYCAGTVLNNVGVFHLWVGEIEAAERALLQAKETLESLASAEVYQPLANLAGVKAARGELQSAKEHLDQAVQWLPPLLLLDQIVLRVDTCVVRFLAGEVSAQDALDEIEQAAVEAREVPDPRLHNQLAFNAARLAQMAEVYTPLRPSDEFVKMINSRDTVGFELLVGGQGSFGEDALMLILSPHWRH